MLTRDSSVFGTMFSLPPVPNAAQCRERSCDVTIFSSTERSWTTFVICCFCCMHCVLRHCIALAFGLGLTSIDLPALPRPTNFARPCTSTMLTRFVSLSRRRININRPMLRNGPSRRYMISSKPRLKPTKRSYGPLRVSLASSRPHDYVDTHVLKRWCCLDGKI